MLHFVAKKMEVKKDIWKFTKGFYEIEDVLLFPVFLAAKNRTNFCILVWICKSSEIMYHFQISKLMLLADAFLSINLTM